MSDNNMTPGSSVEAAPGDERGAGASWQPVEGPATSEGTAPPALVITAHGTPKPKGSMRHIGNGRMIEQVDNKQWRDDVTTAATTIRINAGITEPIDGPVEVRIDFRLPRPKTVTRTWPVKRGLDIDKAVRLVLDSLTVSRLIADDSQVVGLTAWKAYSSTPGARIEIRQVRRG